MKGNDGFSEADGSAVSGKIADALRLLGVEPRPLKTKDLDHAYRLLSRLTRGQLISVEDHKWLRRAGLADASALGYEIAFRERGDFIKALGAPQRPP